MSKTTDLCYAASKLEAHWVTATDNKGMVLYTRNIVAPSAIYAAALASREMRMDDVTWHTIMVGDPARPDHMVTTTYPIGNEEER
jgi:hypothetical protein